MLAFVTKAVTNMFSKNHVRIYTFQNISRKGNMFGMLFFMYKLKRKSKSMFTQKNAPREKMILLVLCILNRSKSGQLVLHLEVSFQTTREQSVTGAEKLKS